MTEKPFSPADHKFAEPKYFEDLAVGEQFYIPSRTLGEANFAAFQTASGDNHPIHYDVEYCRARGHRDLLAHGFQVLIQTAAGAGIFPHVIGDALIGFIEQSSRFLKPVFTVAATVHNQRGELVLEGEQKYLIRRRQPAA